jgi:hypothetical protein
LSLQPQESAFLRPLERKTITFMFDDRGTNIAFACALASILARSRATCEVFDLDALYASNADRIFGKLPSEATSRIKLRVPEPGADIEAEFSHLFTSDCSHIIVDSLNSFYHLVSFEDGVYRGRKLSFAVAGLAYAAATRGGTAIMSMYRREGPPRTGTGASISGLADVTVGVRMVGRDLLLKTERGIAWSGGSYSIRIPSEQPARPR